MGVPIEALLFLLTEDSQLDWLCKKNASATLRGPSG